MTLAIWACVALLGYTYVGYPLVLGALARLAPLRLRADPAWEPTVSVCIAAYNTERWLDAKLASIAALDYPADRLEVLVYSDGSTDATDAIVTRWAAARGNVRLLRGDTRAGKPTGLNRMHAASASEVLFITDSRQPVTPGALRALLRTLSDARVGCVSGNLVLRGSAGSGIYWRYENWLRRQEARFRSMVGMTGPIAALRRSDFTPLPADLILDDMWLPMHLRLRGRVAAFAEDAVAYDDAFADEREFGRKVRTLAGNYQLFARMPRLLLPFVNPSWFETVSHKLLRLACPWVLPVLLVLCAVAFTRSEGAARTSAGALLVVQLAGYLLAALGPRAGRLGNVARTFVVLNVAAIVGAWRLATGRQRITW